MADKKKYYEHLITIRVLADRDLGEISETGEAAEVLRQCYSGDLVGELVSSTTREVTAIHMAELLLSADSDPGFFQLSDAQDLAGQLHDSASTDGCSPDLVVVERRPYNELMRATGLHAYELEEPEDE